MNILPEIAAHFKEDRALRRDLHAHPEIAYEETRTAGIIAEKLRSWGIEVHEGIGKTGVVGILKNGTGTGRIGLRADMDALPMKEANTFAHASTNPKAFHGCGHDGHVTTLLAAARYLAATRRFNGTVIFVFQPAEESRGGCSAMIEDGLLRDFPADRYFGFHNWPGVPSGTVATRAGALMASSNRFRIRMRGKGSHGAMPHLGQDPVFTLIQTAQALQGIITRNKNPLDAAVMSICHITAGTTDNVTPSEAFMEGTLRTFDNAVTDLIEERMRGIIECTAAAWNNTAEFEFTRQYPVLKNDADAARLGAEAAREITLVNAECDPVMPSEDFSFLANAAPSAFMFLGAGDGSHRDAGHGDGPCALHNPSYDFDDNLIPIGASIFARIVERNLA